MFGEDFLKSLDNDFFEFQRVRLRYGRYTIRVILKNLNEKQDIWITVDEQKKEIEIGVIGSDDLRKKSEASLYVYHLIEKLSNWKGFRVKKLVENYEIKIHESVLTKKKILKKHPYYLSFFHYQWETLMNGIVGYILFLSISTCLLIGAMSYFQGQTGFAKGFWWASFIIWCIMGNVLGSIKYWTGNIKYIHQLKKERLFCRKGK